MANPKLERLLGYSFQQPALLSQALTHRSFGTPNNERLEFLGDSVLNCVMAWVLHQRFDQMREGDLSRLRASLVRQEALFRVAESLNLGQYLFLGEGELKSGGARRPSILADALEAVFGAVMLDSGFEAVRALILRLFEPLLAEVDAGKPAKDAKTALQEFLQGRRRALPQYVLKTTRGEHHAQEFEVDCVLEGAGPVATGVGPSRRAAEQEAAKAALDKLSGKR
ncbi:MAG: ribonuclease III [Rhodocyclaceae bacterium]|nr:ribonuclease III [Rhodocyclaceae bacterium]